MSQGPEQLRQLMQKLRENREAAQMRRKKEVTGDKKQGDETRTAQAGNAKLTEVRQKTEKRITNLREELAEKLKDKNKPASKALEGVNLNNIRDEATLQALRDFAEIDPPELQENPAGVNRLTVTLQERLNLAKQSGKLTQEIEIQAQVAAEISARTTVLIVNNPEALDKQVGAVATLVKDSGSKQQETVENVAKELGALAREVPEVQQATRVVLEKVVVKVEVPAPQAESMYEAAKTGAIGSHLTATSRVEQLADNQAYHAQAGDGKSEKPAINDEADTVVVAEAQHVKVSPEKPTAVEELDRALTKLQEIKVITQEKADEYKRGLTTSDRAAVQQTTGEIYENLPDTPEAKQSFTDLMAATVKSRLSEESYHKVDAVVESVDKNVSTKARASAVKGLAAEQIHADGELVDGVADTAVFYLTAQVMKAEIPSRAESVDVVVRQALRSDRQNQKVREAIVFAQEAINDPKLKTRPESNTILSRFFTTFDRVVPEYSRTDQQYKEATAMLKSGASDTFNTAGLNPKAKAEVVILNDALEIRPELAGDLGYLEREENKLLSSANLNRAQKKELHAKFEALRQAAVDRQHQESMQTAPFEGSPRERPPRDKAELDQLGIQARERLTRLIDQNNTIIDQNEVDSLGQLIPIVYSAAVASTPEQVSTLFTQLGALKGLNHVQKAAVDQIKQSLLDLNRYLAYKPRLEDINEYDYRQGGLENEDFEFISSLTGIVGVLERLDRGETVTDVKWIKNGEIDFEMIPEEVLHILNKLFSGPDANRHAPWEQSFSQLYHDPIYQQIIHQLRGATQKITEYYKNHPDKIMPKVRVYDVDPKDGHAKYMEVPLNQAFKKMAEDMITERTTREYWHNVVWIIQTRGKPESLAGYAERFKMEELEVVMLSQKEAASMTRLLEGAILKLLSDRDWINPADLFARKSQVKIDEIIQGLVREVYGEPNKDNEWKIQRAYAIARGVGLGVTGKIMDHLAAADPPRGIHALTGYFGSALLSAWNFSRHHAYRWWSAFVSKEGVANLGGKLPYVQMKSHKGFLDIKGRLRPYTLGEITQSMMKHATDTRVYTKQNKDNVNIPWVEIADLIKVKGLLSRRGWRLRAPLSRHVVDANGNQLRVDLDAKDTLPWEKVDLKASWENLKLVGGPALEWFLDELGGAKLTPEQKRIVIAENINRNGLMKHLRDRNPLRFVWFDNLPENETGSIRKTALNLVKDSQNNLGIFLDVKENRDQVEYDVLVISDMLVRKRVSRLEDLSNADKRDLRTRLGNHKKEDGSDTGINRFDVAEAYWQALQVAAQARQQFFADQYLVYGVESVDLDYEAVRWGEAGSEAAARAFGDINTQAEHIVKPLQDLPDLMAKVSAEKDFKRYVEFLEIVKAKQVSVHGNIEASETVYKIAFLMIKYHDIDVWGRLPGGIGTLSKIANQLVGPKAARSIVQELQGSGAWGWDEQTKGTFIRALVEHGILPAHKHTPGYSIEFEYNAERLDQDTGARRDQVYYDIARSGVPAIMMLIALAALQESEKEERQRAAA